MSKHIFRTLAFLAVLIFSLPSFAEESSIAPLSPEFLKWQKKHTATSNTQELTGSSGKTSPKYAKGYIPDPVDMSHLKNNPPRISNPYGLVGATIPVSYDLRKYSRVPEVRDQNPYGTCWAHAAMGAMESSYLTQAMGTDIDLSELHLAWFTYKDPEDGHSFTMKTSSSYGTGVLGQGGNATMATAYFTRFAGPVNEETMPYSAAGTNTSTADATLTEYVGDKKPSDFSAPVLRLRERYDIGLIDSDNRKLIKEIIMNYGAVQASYYAGDGATSPESSTTAYFDNTHGTETDHAVLFVGWDDDFSRENFSDNDSSRPTSNGAWLVRNSWGDDWGDGGYFYMSYEQYIASGTVYIAAEYDSDTNCYGYDDLGKLGTFGYKSGDASYNVGWAANVFKASDDEQVESVAFYTTDNNCSYDVYVFDLQTTTKPSCPVSTDAFQPTAFPEPAASGYQAYAGYHTVNLASPAAIEAGHYFSVVVKITNPSSNPFAIEYSVEDYATAVVNEGESYFTSGIVTYTQTVDGEKITWTETIDPVGEFASWWSDGTSFSKVRNACIKAFTAKTSSYSQGVNITTAFPDENFRNVVAAFDTDNDGYLSDSELAAVKEIDASGKSIADLTGIEYFTGLLILNVSGNTSLTVLDLSNNTKLQTINITGCTSLTSENITCSDSVRIIDNGIPSLVYNSLTLRGKIGVNFFMYIPEDIDLSTCSMSFDVSGDKSNAMALDEDFTYTADETTYYGFTCDINSVQMANTITAYFNYGDKTITRSYKATNYLGYDFSIYTDTTQNLITAIQDYGHYSQVMLDAAHDEWETGREYAEITAASEITDAYITAVKASADQYAFVNGNSDGSGISAVQYSLNLDSATKINIYLTAADDFTGSGITAYLDGGSSNAAVQQGDNSKVYLVEVDDIPAHLLAKTHTLEVTANTGKTFTLEFSALSYVQNVLNDDTKTDAERKAAAALYKYYVTTMAYRDEEGYDD